MSQTVQGAPHWGQIPVAETSPRPEPAAPGSHPTLWEEGRVRGRDVVLGIVALMLVVVSLDLLLTGRLSFFFDICLVPVCLLGALAVRPREFFWVAVLPPLLVLSTTIELGFVAPQALNAADDGPLQAALVGLADHGTATLWAQGVTLAVLAIRRRVLALPALVPASGKLPPPVDVQGDLVEAYDDALDAAGLDALSAVDVVNEAAAAERAAEASVSR